MFAFESIVKYCTEISQVRLEYESREEEFKRKSVVTRFYIFSRSGLDGVAWSTG